MRFLSSNVIKGKYLCYCNVETKFYVKKLIKTKKKKKRIVFPSLRSPF